VKASAPLKTAARRPLVVVVAATPNYLRQASQNLGKYDFCLNSQSQLCLCLSHSSTCACRQADFRAGRSAQVELHRVDRGPSEERDEEGGVVTLGAGAGRCPGPAAAESGEPRLLRTNGACERAVCLRYGQLVTDLVDGRLLALLTTRYGASRSHIRQAKRYLGCELVHLCALTWVIPSRRAA